MRDIRNKADISSFIGSFYKTLLSDERVNHLFAHIEHLETHQQVIVSFWEGIVFGTSDYRGNVMQKHLHLHDQYGLEASDFDIWLTTFEDCLRSCGFEGPNASAILERANSIAAHMLYKINASDTRLI
jgi:hemoglobin